MNERFTPSSRRRVDYGMASNSFGGSPAASRPFSISEIAWSPRRYMRVYMYPPVGIYGIMLLGLHT